jgi:hypothetical protein
MPTMLYDDISTWPQAQGKSHLMAHIKGKLLTHKQAILAQCYSCTAGYIDGRDDCEFEECPLHQYMPYNKDRAKLRRAGTPMSDERRQQVAETFRKSRKTSSVSPRTPLNLRDLARGDV